MMENEGLPDGGGEAEKEATRCMTADEKLPDDGGGTGSASEAPSCTGDALTVSKAPRSFVVKKEFADRRGYTALQRVPQYTPPENTATMIKIRERLLNRYILFLLSS